MRPLRMTSRHSTSIAAAKYQRVPKLLIMPTSMPAERREIVPNGHDSQPETSNTYQNVRALPFWSPCCQVCWTAVATAGTRSFRRVSCHDTTRWGLNWVQFSARSFSAFRSHWSWWCSGQRGWGSRYACSATSSSCPAECPTKERSGSRSWCRWWLCFRCHSSCQRRPRRACCSGNSRFPMDGCYHCLRFLTYRYFRCPLKFDVHCSRHGSSYQPWFCSTNIIASPVILVASRFFDEIFATVFYERKWKMSFKLR